MINFWWVSRPKRKLISVPELLATVAEVSLDHEWKGQRDRHLDVEDALEAAGLKRKGERRDHSGSGARTYEALLKSLGLLFIHESSRQMKMTLAGEAIINGESPAEVLKWQVLKYQFPSAFSIGRGVNVSPRFRLRPFLVLLALLRDPRLGGYLTQDEIAKIVITETDEESDSCIDRVVKHILAYRNYGDHCLPSDFASRYNPSRSDHDPEEAFAHLRDVANTVINWVEYTQLAMRDDDRNLRVLPEKTTEVDSILNSPPPFISRWDEHEYFQRKYGLDPKHAKDTRNLAGTASITPRIIAENKIKHAYIGESLQVPIASITSALIDNIASKTGLVRSLVEQVLLQTYPHGSIGAFLSSYHEMAFKGRDEAIEFEKATAEIFRTVYRYRVAHVGQFGKSPDIIIHSDSEQYSGIIDNKAYARYSITNDHRNRMIHNYIKDFDPSAAPLAFFSYIAGGFADTIASQIHSISSETHVPGSAIGVATFIALTQAVQDKQYSHSYIRRIFAINRQVSLADFQ